VVTFDPSEPSVLRIWLSRTGTSAVIRGKRPLVGAVAADLDGDHRPELIVRDIFSHLHIWRRDSKASGFRLHAPKRPPQTTRRSGRSIDGGQSEAPEALTGLSGLDVLASPRASADVVVTCVAVPQHESEGVPPAPCLATPSARPPPAHLA
jgi:hypothetical protein